MQLAERLDLAGTGVDLGPARIIRGGTREVVVKFEDRGEVQAQLALALPYAAVEDDIVLVLSKGERHYVVGVLDGAGKTQLRFRGDVELSAMGGSLKLEADKGVTVRSPELSLQSAKLEVVAKSLVQRAQSFYQRVHGLLNVHAERQTTRVDETVHQQSKRATIVTEETIHINGEQIHLG